jgi:hypothetical protein
MSSRLFVRYFGVTAAISLAAVGLFVAIIDPNDTLALSPSFERLPAATNQRFSYTSIARSREFDSLILGTSTTRMLEPANLNRRLNVKLANLSMNSATWWEQQQIFNLFLKNHRQPKLIIWGIDTIWCAPLSLGARLTPRVFPGWLYDDNKWNDYLHILNFKTIERAGRQLAILLRLSSPKYGRDGYKSLNKKGTPYNLGKARRKIYGQVTPIAPAKALKNLAIDEATRKSWSFPNLKTLEKNISTMNSNSRIVLMMVPYHQYIQGAPNSFPKLRYNECKKRAYNIAAKLKNVDFIDFIDFMFRSPFTTEDRNYWDPLHFNEQGAKRIEDSLVDYLINGTPASKIFRTSLKGSRSF